MNPSYLVGVLAALAAAFAWSLNFVVPYVIGNYTTFDFALIRFGVSGAVGAVILIWIHRGWPRTTSVVWFVAAWLAFTGYVGYFLLVSASALFAGPILAPAILGLVPVVLGIIGNLQRKLVPWRRLMAPLSFAAAGLLLVNSQAFSLDWGDQGSRTWMGIGLASGAVVFWALFAIGNEKALHVRPQMGSWSWTAMLLVAGGMQALLFVPIGLSIGVFEFPYQPFEWAAMKPVILWGVGLALFASVGGVWAWNLASRELPVSLAAQLTISETIFGAIGGLVVHQRLPERSEIVGLGLLVLGVALAVRVFHRPQAAAR